MGPHGDQCIRGSRLIFRLGRGCSADYLAAHPQLGAEDERRRAPCGRRERAAQRRLPALFSLTNCDGRHGVSSGGPVKVAAVQQDALWPPIWPLTICYLPSSDKARKHPVKNRKGRPWCLSCFSGGSASPRSAGLSLKLPSGCEGAGWRFRGWPRDRVDEEKCCDDRICRSRWLAHPFAHVRLRKGARPTDLAHLFDGEPPSRERLHDRLR
jgi:hypothetical protein